MGVLAPIFRDVVIVLDTSAALGGIFTTLLNDYILPTLK